MASEADLWEARRISGALYQRVATYSVKLGSPASSIPICVKERAKPKSHSLTMHSLSSKMLEGCNEKMTSQHKCKDDTSTQRMTHKKTKQNKETCTKYKHFTINSPLSWSLSTATDVFLQELLTTSSAQLCSWLYSIQNQNCTKQPKAKY